MDFTEWLIVDVDAILLFTTFIALIKTKSTSFIKNWLIHILPLTFHYQNSVLKCHTFNYRDKTYPKRRTDRISNQIRINANKQYPGAPGAEGAEGNKE